MSDRYGWHTLVQALRIGDAPHLELGPLGQAFQEAMSEFGFIFSNGGHGGPQLISPVAVAPGSSVIFCSGEVIDSSNYSRRPLVVLCAGHPAIGQRIGYGIQFVSRQCFKEFAAAPQNAHMRTEELVSRAGQEIAAPRLDIDRPVRGIM